MVERYKNRYILWPFCMGSKEEALNMTQVTMVKLPGTVRGAGFRSLVIPYCRQCMPGRTSPAKVRGFSWLVDRSRIEPIIHRSIQARW